MSNLIDTAKFSEHLRERAVDLTGRRILITQFKGSEQEKDLTEPPNCAGLGRIRHFRRETSKNWPQNPLPIDPAAKALGHSGGGVIKAQVFQMAACNWRCWYCFVDFSLLSANPRHSQWIRAEELVTLYVSQPDPPPMIDLTGGQPDLVPELVPWMMEALKAQGLDKTVYLWSDDNLSNDYFWRFLSDKHLHLITSYEKYSRVCCFKGFNAESFSFNTRAEPALFENQFLLFSRLLEAKIDLYAYTTFTTPEKQKIQDAMPRFVDKLQSIHANLPLRTVPLEIKAFTPVQSRMNDSTAQAIKNQYYAVEVWEKEIERRFSASQRKLNISQVTIASAKHD
jgi:organic radical activating enzyme